MTALPDPAIMPTSMQGVAVQQPRAWVVDVVFTLPDQQPPLCPSLCSPPRGVYLPLLYLVVSFV